VRWFADKGSDVAEDKDGKVQFKTTSALDAEPEVKQKAKRDDAEEESENENGPSAAEIESGTAPEKPESGTGDAPRATVADPIRMFGILVPPALRSAQTSFREAVEGPVVGLATVAGELRALEREIGRVKKGIRKAG
jgi:hypothetical protein